MVDLLPLNSLCDRLTHAVGRIEWRLSIQRRNSVWDIALFELICFFFYMNGITSETLTQTYVIAIGAHFMLHLSFLNVK